MFFSFKKYLVHSYLILCTFSVNAQLIESDMVPNIQTIRLHPVGNQQGLPVYTLDSREKLQLNFDDLDGNVKNYFYTYVLCDYNWKPVNLSQFDYVKGFTINRISTYRFSSIALTRYTHYTVLLPQSGSMPTRSGNYLLRVFLDGDTAKTVFTKQFLVLDQKTTVSAQIVQPFTPQQFNTHQKLRFAVNVKNINSFSAAQQVKVVILQNNRWDIAQRDIPPTFVRGTQLEYNSENIAIFPGGKEWRWLDLRSFRLQSDRVDSGHYEKTRTELFLKTDLDRTGQRYLFFPDLNGMYSVTSFESINPFWQGDYATVHFRFARPDGLPYPDKEIYLCGQFTGYGLSDRWLMEYNPETRHYETTAFMKQGYYNYAYVAVDKRDPSKRVELEGNYWETENVYSILVYYKGFNDRSDQLIGIGSISSRTDRPGVSF